MTITAPIEIDEKHIASLLCSAFEGGSNYWYRIERFIAPPAVTVRYADEGRVYRHIDYPLNVGGALEIANTEDPSLGVRTLDRSAIEQGLILMGREYPQHMADFLQENDDATTGDVFLQCCLYGRILLG